jgi:FHS family L-fucose permease-like MFS transporter
LDVGLVLFQYLIPSNQLKKILLIIVVPYIAFGVVLFVNYISGQDVTPLYAYAFVIVFK